MLASADDPRLENNAVVAGKQTFGCGNISATEILPHFDSSAKHKTRMYILLFAMRLLVYACLFVSRFRLLCICLAFPRVVFVWIMNCTLSHMLGQVTSSANGHQLYTIKIDKDFLMRLLNHTVTNASTIFSTNRILIL